jgi:SAM-dependent methyltransferase
MSSHDAPSPHVVRWAAAIPAGGTVLDLAAGGGRHTRFFLDRGHAVVAVDRDTTALHGLARPGLEVVTADLEATDAVWPFAARRFAGVVVVNYLWRPLLPHLVACVQVGGALLYETFAQGHERLGRPRRPEFLLAPGELLDAVRGELEVLEYANGDVGEPPHAVRQRLLAVRRA